MVYLPKRLLKTKKRATVTTIIILLGIYTILNIFNKIINAYYVAQNGFQMASYHPWTFWISLIGSILWLTATKLKGLRAWWYIPGILGIIYALYMLLGGIIVGGWFF